MITRFRVNAEWVMGVWSVELVVPEETTWQYLAPAEVARIEVLVSERETTIDQILSVLMAVQLRASYDLELPED